MGGLELSSSWQVALCKACTFSKGIHLACLTAKCSLKCAKKKKFSAAHHRIWSAVCRIPQCVCICFGCNAWCVCGEGGGGGFAAFPGVLCISTLAYFFFCLFVFLLDTIRWQRRAVTQFSLQWVCMWVFECVAQLQLKPLALSAGSVTDWEIVCHCGSSDTHTHTHSQSGRYQWALMRTAKIPHPILRTGLSPHFLPHAVVVQRARWSAVCVCVRG